MPRQQVMNECSPTLLALLAAIAPSLDSTLPAAMIGHIVTSAVNSYFTSLQLAVSVLLSRQRKVIEQLHDFGVTSSYDELRRFRISAATAMASVPRGLAQFDSSHGLVQVVADNFDTQISSQNGHKSTHGLAMILTQANYQKPQLLSQDHNTPRIKRLSKTETKADNLMLGEVKVHRYMGAKKPPMPEEFCQRVVPSLAFLANQQISLNRAATEDLAFFKQRLHPDVLKKFMLLEQVMHHQDGLWNGLWSDQFIETTYMRYGHGPSGIIGSSLNESTLAIWVFSHSTLTQIYNDMETLKEGQEDVVVTTHKEERQSRINDDASDRAKIQERLSTCIDILDTSKHPKTGLVNVYSGRIIDDPTVNVHEAVKIGTEQQKAFEGKWPASFHLKLKRRVKNIASLVKSQLKMGKDIKAIDTGFIYARVLGIMASSREPVSIEALFSHELAPLPTALFDETGDMRTTSKAVLKNKINIVCGVRNKPSPSVVVLDGCAILWTVPWPAAPAQVSAFINAAITTILRRADNTSVLHVVFDRYFELSTKACCRTSRQKGNSRVFTFTEDTPLPKQSLVLNMTYNKKQLIQLIVDRLCAMQPPLGTDVVITGSDPQPVHMGSGLKEPSLT
ncbi:hypothetical protein ACOMHN_054361 [Nucella lapillus]